MRILIFSNAYKPTVSGVVTSIELFRQGLLDAGHEVFIVAPEYKDYQDQEPYIFRFPALDMRDQVDLSLVLPFKSQMTPIVRGVKPALIHSQHPVWMGHLAADFARDYHLPLVFTFHTRYVEYAKKYVPLAHTLSGLVTEEIIRHYLESCTHIVAPTPTIRDLINNEYGTDVPVSVVPTPVDLSQYRNLAPMRVRTNLGLEETELLLYVGRLAEEKNLDFLLRAFARIATIRPKARLLLVGKGPHEHKLRLLSEKLGLVGRAIFAGSIPHTEVPHYAAAADLFVFPSLLETQGLVLIEAMAAGTPVVALEAPGSLDVLAEGGGLLVPDQEDAFVEAILGLIGSDNEGRLCTLQRQAKKVVQRYAVPAAADRLATIYREAIIAGPRST